MGSNREEQLIVKRACDTCRKKKIRCDPVSDTCTQCIKSKSPCHFTSLSVLKSRRRLTRDKRVEELEKRLAWMESQLKLPLDGRQSLRDSELNTIPKVQTIATLEDHDRIATDRIFGRSLLLDPASFQHGDRSSNAALIADRPPVLELGTPGQGTHFVGNATPIFQKLPSKEKALHLVTLFFQAVNTVHPIFDQDTFISKFNSAYGIDYSDDDPGWWAALNVVLALAYHLWDVPTSDPNEDLEAWGYFQNALAATSPLMTRHYTLASVQALLGMAMLMMATPYQGHSNILASSAIKIAHRLGLHRQCQYPMRSAIESSERIRVFWVAYYLDKDISLQTRQPPTQSEEDMDIEPPSEYEYSLTQHGVTQHSLYHFRTKLAIIQGQVYRRLLSVMAEKLSATERAMAAEELQVSLQTWKRTVPVHIFCDYSGPAFDESRPAASHHPLYLQLLYFKTLATIHESLATLPWHDEVQTSEVRIHIASGLVTYPEEARSAMKLFSVTPRRRLACVWTALHVFTSAATTLLNYTISNPSNPLVQLDLRLLEPFLNVMKYLARSSKNEKVERLYQSEMFLFEQAKGTLEHSGPRVNDQHMESEGSSARESLQDFLERMEHISSGDDTLIGFAP